jgi:hypothetical protein
MDRLAGAAAGTVEKNVRRRLFKASCTFRLIAGRNVRLFFGAYSSSIFQPRVTTSDNAGHLFH